MAVILSLFQRSCFWVRLHLLPNLASNRPEISCYATSFFSLDPWSVCFNIIISILSEIKSIRKFLSVYTCTDVHGTTCYHACGQFHMLYTCMLVHFASISADSPDYSSMILVIKSWFNFLPSLGVWYANGALHTVLLVIDATRLVWGISEYFSHLENNLACFKPLRYFLQCCCKNNIFKEFIENIDELNTTLYTKQFLMPGYTNIHVSI